MIKVSRTKKTEDICAVTVLLSKYFKPYEMVSSNEIHYYARCYSKSYPGEDYLIYKITDGDNLVGCMLGVALTEFVVIDYFVIDEQYRANSKVIIKMAMDEILSFNRPIVVEAESELLCRLYRMLGFKRFTEPYEYAMANVSLITSTMNIETHKSNLLYLSNDTMTFNSVRDILYFKHYLRWCSIYKSEFVEEYKEHLKKMAA